MARSDNQKIKILVILETLRLETDENHPMSTKQLIQRLSDKGIEAERKSVYADIKTLNDNGYEIMTVRRRNLSYYIADREFDLPELRILMDAVNSARFITAKKSKALIGKLALLRGIRNTELTKKSVTRFDTVKLTNENIYYNVDAINDAICRKKKLSFVYFHYSVAFKKKYAHDGEEYVVNPLGLAFENGNYYMSCYSDKYENVAYYRVDRMEDAIVLEDDITPAPWLAEERSSASEVFSMYSGTPCRVVLSVHGSVIDAVIDKFGYKVHHVKDGEDRLRIEVNVQLSPTFYSWCFTYGDKIVIESPVEAVEGMRETLAKVMKIYEE